jgi:uncharacterized protein (DUF488 family)
MNENAQGDKKSDISIKITPSAPVILTIGHSNRSIDEFLDLLRAHSVERLFDIRTIPRSRHNPHFNTGALAESLHHAGIEYIHVPELGGLRHASKNSVNAGWKNASFRGYADYMQTPEFDAAIAPWRCHRSLVADALIARGIAAEHIMSAKKRDPHSLTPFATLDGARVTYPAPHESGKLPFK